MAGRRSRNKGAAFEREIARRLRVVWPDARRGIGQARSASEVSDVEGTPYWIECKRCKKVNVKAAIKQAYEAREKQALHRPIVIIWKEDYGDITVSEPWWELTGEVTWTAETLEDWLCRQQTKQQSNAL